MADSPSRWSVRQLVLSWAGYWVASAVVWLGPAFVAGWHVTHLPPDQGAINASLANGSFTLSMLESGSPVWTGTASAIAVALWIAVPPLALWSVWMLRNARIGPVEPLPVAELHQGAAAGVDAGRRQAVNEMRDPS